jgi:hypothetical protein
MIVMSGGHAHASFVHAALRQSDAAAQRLPTVQGPHALPPQSTSVSSPFVLLS